MREDPSKYSFLFLLSFIIIISGCSSSVKMKVFRGDIDLRDKTPLMYAIQVGDDKKALKFIERGAEINVKNETVDLMTPLHYAVATNNLKIVRVLIEKGADVNTMTDILWTPLHYSACLGNKNITQLLLKNGADLNSRDGNLHSPLYYAVRNNKVNIVKYLITAGAKIYPNTQNAENSFTTAKCYKFTGKYLDENVSKEEVLQNYELAIQHFDIASKQFEELISSLNIKKAIIMGTNVILSAASMAGAKYQANMQAKQMAQISALKSSDHVGIGYGIAPYHILPATARTERLTERKIYYEKKLAESRQAVIDCRSIMRNYK